MTERRPYAGTAETYWRAGWPNPIPVKGKFPPVVGYTGYDGANVSWPDLQAWIEAEQGDWNIALRLPGDIVGIDVDAYDGKTGAASLAAAQEALGQLPATVRSTARAPFGESGIWLFRVPTGVSLRGAEKRFVARFGDHVDIIRRDHRYAVVWPSVNPKTGGMYLWYGVDGELLQAPPRPQDLAELPPAWLEFLTAPAAGDASPAAQTFPIDPGPAGESPWDDMAAREFTRTQAAEFVRPSFERLRSAPDGTINNRLNEAALTLGHFVPSFWTTAQAHAFLMDALASTEYDGRTWRAEATIDSGLRAKTWRAVLKEEIAPIPANDDRFKPLDWHALWTDESQEEWIVEPILPARRGVALYSPPKIGKSLLALELVVAIARGGNVLGTQVERPFRVLYVDFENDPKGDIRPRLQDMGFGPDDLGNLIYLSFPPLGPLDTALGAAELLSIVDLHGAEVIVIDTVSRSIKGEENENDTWLAFYRHLGKELKARGVAMLRLDHTGKDETKGQRGGSAKSGDVDMVWRMSKVTETVYRLECEAHRMPVMETSLTLHRETAPKLWHRVDAAGRFAAWEAKIKQLVKALDDAGVDPNSSRRATQPILKGMGLTARAEVLSEVIRRRRTIDVDE